MTLESILAALVVATGLIFAPTPQAFADQFVDPDFATETVTTVAPYTAVKVAFAPDGRIFIAQKNGVVRVYKNGVLLPAPFVDISAQVNNAGDRGLLGFAFDPDFANNGYVYLSYVYENLGQPQDQGARTSRLTRMTADPVNPDIAMAGSETVILGGIGTAPCSDQPAGADCIPADAIVHSLGDIEFAPDGTLFVGNGDATGPGTRTVRAQDLDSYSGKVLHINKDGTAVPTNPFYDGTNSIRSKVWVSGLRNPFRLSVNPTTGEPWIGDVGWNSFEEVNRGVKGANLGWPCYEGNLPVSAYAGLAPCTTLAQSSVTFAFHSYSHSIGSCVIGGPFYTGTAYPPEYRGNLFFADYVGGFIKRVVFDGSGNPMSVQDFASNVNAPVDLVQGPDGLLYYVSITTGEIRRIVWRGITAVASATPRAGYSPLTVNFSSAGSQTPGGGALSYRWDFGDGTNSTEANPSHTYTSDTVHTYVAMLTVTSPRGSNSSTVDITVGSVPPVPVITSPGLGATVRPGQVVTYAGGATDPDDGPVPPDRLNWTVLLHHNTHVHTMVATTGASGTFVVEDHGSIGSYWYEVILTATDSDGLSGTTSLALPVGFDGSPPSAPAGLTANGVTAAVELSWPPATDNVAVAGYRVERCTGGGCADFATVGTTAATSYVDTGLAASTAYRYRVFAIDPSNQVSDASPIATATTAGAPAPDGSAPSAPSTLTAVPIRANQVDLGWPAAGDDVGVRGYRVERCAGTDCSDFAAIAAPGTPGYSDLGLPASATYRYRVAAVDAAGNVGGFSPVATVTTGAVALPAGAFVPLTPSRLLDTRKGIGAPTAPVAPFAALDLQVTGQGGVPESGVAAVVLNLTVTQPTAGGFLTAYPTGEPMPLASNLNFEPGSTIPNLATVKVGAGGKVSLFNGTGGTVHLIADVAGYYLAGTPTQPGTFVPLTPSRLLDTRKGTGAAQHPVAPTGTLDLQVAGAGGVPATGAAAVVLNLTVTQPTAGGYVTAFPAGTDRPLASNLNLSTGQTISNLVTVKLGANGMVSLYNGTGGTLELIADVAGYYLAGTPSEPGTFVSLSPARILDTRSGGGAPVNAGGLLSLPVAGSGGVPDSGVGAAVMNVTVTAPTDGGYVTVFPTGDAIPVASNLNFSAGQTIPNLVIAKLGQDGQVTLRNGTGGTIHLVADVAGYFIR